MGDYASIASSIRHLQVHEPIGLTREDFSGICTLQLAFRNKIDMTNDHSCNVVISFFHQELGQVLSKLKVFVTATFSTGHEEPSVRRSSVRLPGQRDGHRRRDATLVDVAHRPGLPLSRSDASRRRHAGENHLCQIEREWSFFS